MSRPRNLKTTRYNKCIVVPLFDIHEDGYHIGLNNVVMFHRFNDSPNMSLQSRLQTCKKSVCVSTVLRGVFA
jgi:hypothetical protein